MSHMETGHKLSGAGSSGQEGLDDVVRRGELNILAGGFPGERSRDWVQASWKEEVIRDLLAYHDDDDSGRRLTRDR